MDEDHNYILVPELAEIKSQFSRRARKYNACTICGTQQVKDYADPSIKQHGQAIFDNATYKFFFNLSKDGVQDLAELMTLTDGEKQQIESFPPYCGLFEIGNKKLPVSVLITDEEKAIIDDV